MQQKKLIEETFTRHCSTEAGDTIRATDLTLEFVIVCEFLVYVTLVVILEGREKKLTHCNIT